MSALAPPEFRSIRAALLSAVAAGFCWFTGVALAMWAFNRSNPMPYSPWDHTISELGFPGASSLAWFYNSSVVAMGLLLLPTYRALRRSFATRAANVAAGFGWVACLGLVGLGLQGLYPDLMDPSYRPLWFLSLHNDLAAVFFLGWLGTVVVFTGIFLKRRRDPFGRLVAGIGMVAALLYPVSIWVALRADPMGAALARDLRDPAFVLRLKASRSAAFFSPWFDSHRPATWRVAALEWSVAGSFLLWHAMVWLYLWRQTRPSRD